MTQLLLLPSQTVQQKSVDFAKPVSKQACKGRRMATYTAVQQGSGPRKGLHGIHLSNFARITKIIEGGVLFGKPLSGPTCVLERFSHAYCTPIGAYLDQMGLDLQTVFCAAFTGISHKMCISLYRTQENEKYLDKRADHTATQNATNNIKKILCATSLDYNAWHIHSCTYDLGKYVGQSIVYRKC